MFAPSPVSLLQVSLFWLIAAIGAVGLLRAFHRTRGETAPSARSGRSRIGIALQAIGFAAVGMGPIRVALPWSAHSSLACSVLVLLLGGSGIAIFTAAARAMGKNWSVVARTREDHELVRSGPFAIVRHPIYLALFLYLLSFGVAFGHFRQLLIAIPFYVAGAIVRIRIEEKLLRAQFGETHARYVREVPAFIPFLK